MPGGGRVVGSALAAEAVRYCAAAEISGRVAPIANRVAGRAIRSGPALAVRSAGDAIQRPAGATLSHSRCLQRRLGRGFVPGGVYRFDGLGRALILVLTAGAGAAGTALALS